MRFLKGVLVGLLAGVVLTAAVLTLEMVHADRSVSAKMPDCKTHVFREGIDTVCDTTYELGAAEVPVTFVVGFAAAFAWSLRRRRLAQHHGSRRRRHRAVPSPR
jgi:uncharacterized protein (TIGR03382 family)